MTISTTTIKNSYTGNGSTSAFTYTFKITDDDDIQVIIRSATGIETVKTKTTHYTVSGVGNAAGGTITFTAGNIPASTQTVILRRSTPQTQELDLIANSDLPSDSLENAYDKLTSITQELQEQVDRSLKLSRTNSIASTEFIVGSTDRANKVLSFDSNGEIAITQELGTYKGDWSTGTNYLVRDLIKDTSNNNIYYVSTDHTSSGSQPLSSNVNSTYYILIVDAASATSSANSAATSATNAATSATSAANSATASSTSATNSASSATSAANSATTATTQATNAASSATSASSSASTATTKASEASTSATNAATSASSALASKNDAAASATAAQTAQTAVETVFDNFDDRFLGSKTTDPTVDNDGNALLAGAVYYNSTFGQVRFYNGATWDAPSAQAATSASNALTSANNAASSATSASASASTATTQAGIATTKANEAATSETNAANSATAASNSATSASTSASTATTQASTATTQAGIATTKASEASTSATNAATSASSASSSASTATTQANNASTSAANALTSETNAATSATNAAQSYDSFDDRYLGAKSSAPTLDNDGNSLLTGAIYWNSSVNQLYIWNGTNWDAAAFSVTGTVTSFNTRTGAVTLSNSDITTALGLTPISASSVNTLTNKSISGIDNTISNLNANDLSSGTVPSARLSLTSSDLPTVPTTKGGTGLTSIGTANQYLKVNSGATGLEYGTVDLSNLSASNLTSGTIPAARYSTSDVITPTATQTLTNKSISGSANTLTNIPNSALTNNSVTINGSTVSLGGSTSIVTVTYPTIASISPSTITNDPTDIVITGTNFVITPNVEIISTSGKIYYPNTIVRNSSTQITINVTLLVDGNYYIRVENPDGIAARSTTAFLTVSDIPVWSTAAGSLGSLSAQETGSFTVAATSDSSITYSLISGSLPSGLSLNTSTGVISGTENVATDVTVYNFTIRATDAENQTTDRTFSITVTVGINNGVQFN